MREAGRKRGRQGSLATITRDNCSVIAHEISRNFEIVIPKTPRLQISSIHLELYIYSIHLEISPIHLDISPIQLQISTNIPI